MASFQVRVLSPERVIRAGEASSLVAPAWDGQVGILPGHAPMIVLIGTGTLAVDLPGGGSESYNVAGGVLKVEANHVTVLTERAGCEAPSNLSGEERSLRPQDRQGPESASVPGRPA